MRWQEIEEEDNKKSFVVIVIPFFNQDGNTPLHIAATMGHEKLIEMLLNAGSSTTVKNNVSNWKTWW